MDQLAQYRQILKDTITQSQEYRGGISDPSEDTIFIGDESTDCYLLMRVGWRDKLRIQQIVFFARIKDGKIWIEEDWTKEGLAAEFAEAGIPHDDIVLAFHPPHLHQYTEYAAA